VVFSEAFSAAPNVVVSTDDERFIAARKNVTATGFDVTTYYVLGAVAGGGFTLNLSWQAHL
jgi:hypothetical protein